MKEVNTLCAVLDSEYLQEKRDEVIQSLPSAEAHAAFQVIESAFIEAIEYANQRADRYHDALTKESTGYLQLALNRRNSAIAEFISASGIKVQGDGAQQLRAIVQKLTFGQIKIVEVTE